MARRPIYPVAGLRAACQSLLPHGPEVKGSTGASLPPLPIVWPVLESSQAFWPWARLVLTPTCPGQKQGNRIPSPTAFSFTSSGGAQMKRPFLCVGKLRLLTQNALNGEGRSLLRRSLRKGCCFGQWSWRRKRETFGGCLLALPLESGSATRNSEE